jgi:hypothetical protein
MSPVMQIVPGVDIPETDIVVYAKNQPPYIPLPMWKGDDGLRISRWKLTWRERFQILFGGSLWLSILTFNNPLQPVKLEVRCPLVPQMTDQVNTALYTGIEGIY